MSNAIDAAEALSRMTLQYEHLKYAADLLQEYGSFDNALTEIKRMHRDALDTLHKIRNEVSDLTEEKRKILEHNRKIAKDVEVERKAMFDKLSETEDKMLKGVEAARDRLLAEARAVNEKEKRKFNDAILELNDERNKLQDSINNLIDTRKNLSVEVHDLEDKLNALKSEMAKFVHFFNKEE